MFLRLEAERVHVDSLAGGDIGVMLERLHEGEVVACALAEPVVAIQLQLGAHNGVLTVRSEVICPLVGAHSGFGFAQPKLALLPGD